LACQKGLPTNDAQLSRPHGLHPSFVLAAFSVKISALCRRTLCAQAPPFEQASPLSPRGPRSGPGYSVPVHQHLIDPIRPTRRHISISSLCGLYEMPSLCVSRLGDPRVVPCFRCAVFIDTSPSSTPGSSSVARTQFLRRQRWPSSPHKSLGTSQIPTIRFPWGNPFRGWTTIRICYDLSICSPPLADLTRLYAQPTGTFTSGLPTD